MVLVLQFMEPYGIKVENGSQEIQRVHSSSKVPITCRRNTRRIQQWGSTPTMSSKSGSVDIKNLFAILLDGRASHTRELLKEI